MILFFISSLWANNITINKIVFKCSQDGFCIDLKKKYSSDINNSANLDDLIRKLKSISNDTSISKYSYKIYSNKLGYYVKVYVKRKKIIRSIKLERNNIIGLGQVIKIIPIKVGSFYNRSELDRAALLLKQYILDRGHRVTDINYNIKNLKTGLEVKFYMIGLKYDNIMAINIKTDNKVLSEDIIKNIKQYKGSIFNKKDWINIMENIKLDIFNKGFLKSNVSLKTSKTKKGIILNVGISYGSRYLFSFRGLNILERLNVIETIKRNIKLKKLDTTNLSDIIKELYVKKGIFNTDIKYRINFSRAKDGTLINTYYFDITEGNKIRIKDISFLGVNDKFKSDLYRLYYKNATDLASRKYFDKDYLEKFNILIKKYYLSKGFLFVKIPLYKVIRESNNVISILYTINEGIQSNLEKIDLGNIPSNIKDKILSNIVNQEGKPLNITVVEKDMLTTINILREHGYFFARISEKSERNPILYSSDFSRAVLNLNYILGYETLYDDYKVIGLVKTKKVVVSRILKFKKGDTITFSSLDELSKDLNSLGLFSYIKIKESISKIDYNNKKYWIRLIIHVDEKEFGFGEFAPGYRTDIGAKLSTFITYNNMWGLNHSSSINLQANQRFDYNTLDERRRSEKKNLIEYLFKVNYTWPFMKFFTTFDFHTSLSFQRKRYYGFDSDIARISPQLSKKIGNHFSYFLQYQYENIKQFDATNLKDQDEFRIGSIIPSVEFDYRDSSILPTKGFFSSFSFELSNPSLGSISRDDTIVNFYKVVSRNKFYFPINNHVNVAMSFSFGKQGNLENDIVLDSNGNIVYNSDGTVRIKGYIPSVKVFRLNGFDMVRGFSDNEINTLESGVNVSDIRVDSDVYFTNFKIEPRYYLSDITVLGFFLDAGGLFLDHYKPLKLRKSVGFSFKFVMPVGTIDFSYGIKLKRRINNGVRERFGNFNFSIGHF